jgi:hypothetical protein
MFIIHIDFVVCYVIVLFTKLNNNNNNNKPYSQYFNNNNNKIKWKIATQYLFISIFK